MDLWDLKHHFELAVQVAAPAATVQPLNSGTGWEAVASGQRVGWAGPVEADSPRWAGALLGFEVQVSEAAPERPRFQLLPGTPSVVQDVALVLPEGVSAAAVSAVLRRVGGPLLEQLEVFDEYRGPKLKAGERSVAWHLTFRDPTRTLREAEVDKVIAAALKALKEELDVRRRES